MCTAPRLSVCPSHVRRPPWAGHRLPRRYHLLCHPCKSQTPLLSVRGVILLPSQGPQDRSGGRRERSALPSQRHHPHACCTGTRPRRCNAQHDASGIRVRGHACNAQHDARVCGTHATPSTTPTQHALGRARPHLHTAHAHAFITACTVPRHCLRLCPARRRRVQVCVRRLRVGAQVVPAARPGQPALAAVAWGLVGCPRPGEVDRDGGVHLGEGEGRGAVRVGLGEVERDAASTRSLDVSSSRVSELNSLTSHRRLGTAARRDAP